MNLAIEQLKAFTDKYYNDHEFKIKQLAVLVNQYQQWYDKVKDKYTDPEYLAWISISFDQSQWPTEGEFPKARADNDFREFRKVFKNINDAVASIHNLLDVLKPLEWGIIPRETRDSYREQFLKEQPEEVPF